MGVPKFYRWISERYPCLSEVVKEYQIPEFDNLYLDMNGIVHVCSHPEDDNPHFRITEEKIFQDIFHYIEVLFRMIKPKKVFFMAIDGVAPRAKMNQQRGRRFRSAREAEMLVRKALEKGETLPSEERFDSNCITPGTEFMVKLQEQLKYFVVNKITTDKLWQGPRIFLSGHETPGEGEHKVMDFIRYERSVPNYDPNTRHCLYGLDADLMMLGLSSHEPHFSLLREEVRFGGKNSQKRSTAPEETVFHLLHLSLFREYLDYEFSDLKGKLPFGYDIERIIDDWILMGFLVGNDFIPHLPNLHIHHDALPLLWRTYKQVLPTIDGYLHDGGTLNLPRFEKYMKKLSEFDVETFADNFADLKWLEGKAESKAAKDEANARRRRGKASVSSNDAGIPTANEFMILKNSDDDDDLRAAMGAITLEEFEEDEDEFIAADSQAMQADFREHKDAYYMDKMKLGASREMLKDQAEGYVLALQWILHYYFNGVPSWSWFYPHHYAPYLSDVKDFANMKMKFDIATPFMPFQQLMAVLPAASKNLLPKALQPLMISDSSPVIDFYPQEFDLDLNGKMQEWEAVVQIPFIEEKRLISAMKPLEENMNTAEKLRNRHSEHILYQFDPKSQGTYQSSLPGKFPDILNHHSRITLVHKDEFRIAPEKIYKGLCKGMTGDVYFPGFPTLKHIPHKFRLARTGVKVFQMNSKGENTILTLNNQDIVEIEQVAREYISKSVYVAWPHLTESKVVAVADCNEKYTLKEGSLRRRGHKGKEEEPIEIERVNMDRDDSQIWCKEVHGLTDVYKDRKGVEIGDTDILLYAVPMVGRKYVQGVRGLITLEKQWGTRAVPHALQTTVKDIVVKDPSFKQFKTLDELFPAGTEVFMLGQPYYGCMGEVLEIDQKNEGRIRVNFTKHQEPNMDIILKKRGQYESRYHNSYHSAKRVGVSSYLISRITGVLYLAPGSKEKPPASNNKRTNVGLNLKFNKTEKEVPGYTKKSKLDNQWQYSEKLLQIIGEYIEKFPELFEYIAKKSNEENYYEDDVFGEDDSAEKIKEVKDYIKSLPCSSVGPANFGTLVLDDSVVTVIESAVSKATENNKKRKRIKMQVKPHLLYRPLDAQSNLIPDPTATHEQFDRVVNVREGYSVPVGLRGTIIGVCASPKEQDQLYEVVFDEEFMGGFTIRCSPNRGYRVPSSALINLTHGQRKEEARSFKPTAVVKPLPGQDFMPMRAGGPNPLNSNPWTNQPSSHQFQQQPYQQTRYNYQGNNQQQSQPDFYPQWKSQSGNSSGSSSSYQQLKQQGSQMGHGSYQQSQQQHKTQQPYNPVFSGSKQQYQQDRYGDQHPQRPRNDASPQNVQYSQQSNQPAKDHNSFANVWSQLQGGSNNMPSSWNKPEVAHSQPPHQQLLISPNTPSLEDAAKALQSSNISPSTAPQKQPYNQTGNNNRTNNPGGQKKISPQQYPYPVESPADLFSVPPPDLPKLDLTHLFSVPPPPLPGGVPVGQRQQQNPNEADDFNRLMAALHSDTSGMPYTSPHSTAKEGTQALQEILKVNTNEKPPPEQQHSGKNYGKQLSVQELFQGAADKPSEAALQVNTQQKRTPQKQTAQQDSQRKRNPVGELLTYCTSMGMLAPRYDYTPAGDGRLFCLVTLPNGEQYKGSYAKDRRQAMDSAAKNALTNLQQQQQQPGFQRNMPGIFGGQSGSRTEQHKEDEEDSHGNFAASPNSAFTPFKGKDPFETDMRDHRNHYGQPFPNPPNHPNFQSPPQAFVHTKHEPPHGHVNHQDRINNQNHHMMHPNDHGHSFQNFQQNLGYMVSPQNQAQNQVAGHDLHGAASKVTHDHHHQQQQHRKPRHDSESEGKKDNPFVPLQVMKKQKTPAKSEKKNKTKESNSNLQQDNTESKSNSTNEQKNSTVEESNSKTPVVSKKQIQFTDPVKETKSPPKSKGQKVDGKSSQGASGTGKSQPKRPRSRIAAKFN